MKTFIKNTVLFFGIVVSLYFGFFYAVDQGLKNSEHLEYGEWNEIYDGNINADIIIQGSSRAWRQLNPKTIENSTKKSVYNLGMDGYHFPMQECRYDVYRVKNKKPKYIIQILDHFTLTKRANLFNKHQFLPYIKDSIIQNKTSEYEGFSWSDYNIPFFCYFGSKEITFAGLAEFTNLKKFKSNKYNGFGSNDKSWEPGFDKEKKQNPAGKRMIGRMDVFKELNSFIEAGKEENIELILIYPPDYVEFQSYITNRDSIMSAYNYLANRNDITFIDFSSDTSLCGNKDYFYNPTHLNTRGSEIFSKKVSDTLNNLYNF